LGGGVEAKAPEKIGGGGLKSLFLKMVWVVILGVSWHPRLGRGDKKLIDYGEKWGISQSEERGEPQLIGWVFLQRWGSWYSENRHSDHILTGRKRNELKSRND